MYTTVDKGPRRLGPYTFGDSISSFILGIADLHLLWPAHSGRVSLLGGTVALTIRFRRIDFLHPAMHKCDKSGLAQSHSLLCGE